MEKILTWIFKKLDRKTWEKKRVEKHKDSNRVFLFVGIALTGFGFGSLLIAILFAIGLIN